MIFFILMLLVLVPLDSARAGENLLINGDAETGDITGWTASSPQFRAITTAQGFPVYEGNWSFSAGPAGGTSLMWQDIDLSALGSCIDSGSCSFELTGWCRTDDGDSARFEIFFSGPLAGSRFDSGYFSNPPAWVPIAASGILPSGIRTARVYLHGKGEFGFWINVYFDLLSFSLAPSTAADRNTWGKLKSKYR